MIELPDDELDKLFRKSSEEFDPIYEPNDWNDLRKRLDAEDGGRPAGWWRKWLPLGLLFFAISVGGILFGLRENGMTRSDQKPVQQRQAVNAIENENNKNEKVSVIEEEKAGGEAGNVVREPEKNVADPEATKEDKTKSNTVKILPPSRSKAGGVYLEPNRSSGRVGEGAFLTSKKPAGKTEPIEKGDGLNLETPESANGASKQNSQKSKLRSKPGVRIENAGELQSAGSEAQVSKKNGSVPDLRKNDVDPVSLEARVQQGQWMADRQMLNPRVAKQKGMVLPMVRETEEEEPAEERFSLNEEKKSTPSPLFAVRFSYAPDVSAVGLKNFSRPGSAVSLMGEWAIFKRAYVQTGVAWSNKIYGANSGDYGLSWQHYYGPYPDKVNGECKIFEVPLNIRYDIFQGEGSRWFASAGATSYHMNSELYKYAYENEDDPKIKYREWAGSTGWYLFSHLNASAGYEYRLTRRLSLIAEPYVRIPLKRVGYGKVNLFTTGAWISIRYTPVFKMK